MKKMKRILAVVLCVLAVASVLAGCGKKDMSGSKFCGTWTATTAEYSGVELGVSDIFGGDVVLDLGADGKCTFSVNGEEEKGKWDEVDGTVVIDGDEDLTFVEDGGELVLDFDGVTIRFAK